MSGVITRVNHDSRDGCIQSTGATGKMFFIGVSDFDHCMNAGHDVTFLPGNVGSSTQLQRAVNIRRVWVMTGVQKMPMRTETLKRTWRYQIMA